jgi:hypothetical protein
MRLRATYQIRAPVRRGVNKSTWGFTVRPSKEGQTSCSSKKGKSWRTEVSRSPKALLQLLRLKGRMTSLDDWRARRLPILWGRRLRAVAHFFGYQEEGDRGERRLQTARHCSADLSR